jgi:esterase
VRSILFLALLTAAIPATAAAQADSRAAAKQPASAAHGGGVEQPRTELPAGTKSLRVNGYDMAYVERGAGQPVLLIHGIFTDFRYFSGVMDAFPPNYRFIAVSLRHYYPERWDGKGGSFSMRQHVDDVAAFVRELNAGAVHLVGHSRGGSLALYMAKDHPELVRTLTLAEPGMPAFQPAGGASAGGRKSVLESAAALLDQGKTDKALASLQIGGPDTWEAGPEAYRQMLRDNAWTLKGLISDPGDKWAPYTCADAGRIAVPVLLVGGEKSPPERGKSLDAIQSCLKRSERAVIAGVGHPMPRLNPVGFSEAVLRFITKH